MSSGKFISRFKQRFDHPQNIVRFLGPIIFFAGLVLLYGYRILELRNQIGFFDWDLFIFYHQNWHLSFFSFKQFPLWNPYIRGGMSYIGRPDVCFFPWPFIFGSIFGLSAGLRIMASFYLFIAMTGMFYLCRHLKIKILPAVIASVIFGMNGCFAFRIMGGHLGWLSAAYLPWVFLFYFKGLKKVRHLFVSALFLTFIVFEGSYIFLFTVIFLALFGEFYSLQTEKFKPLLAVGLVVLLCFLFSGPKLFPMIELMNQAPRPTLVGDPIRVPMLYDMFLNRAQSDKLAIFGWWEVGAYIGVLPVVLFFLSFKLYKKYWPLLATAVILLGIGIGNFSNFSPWAIIHRWPVFQFIHIPSRIFIVFFFPMALLCGLYLNSLRIKSRIYNGLLGALLIFLIWDLSVVNASLFHYGFGRETISGWGLFRDQPFRQIEAPAYSTDEIYGRSKTRLSQILQNRGVIGEDYESIPVPIYAIPFGSPDYKGEFYLLEGNGRISQLYWSPNKMIYRINTETSDTVIINQNYDKGWRAASAQSVRPYNGLISVHVDPGDWELILYYFPSSFVYGILAGLLGLIVCLVMLKMKIEWKDWDDATEC